VLSLLLHTHTSKPSIDMFSRSCGDDDSDHQMSVCLVSLDGSPRLPRYSPGSCEVLSKVPPVISRILPSSDYLWSTHTSTAPLRGLASVYENRMAFVAKVAYLERWDTATPCTHVEPSVRSLLARRRDKDALVDFVPIERATHLRTLTECRSNACSTTAEPSVPSTAITAAFSPPKAQPEDGTLLSFENALRAVQALPLEDIIPTADVELPEVAPVNPQALQSSRRVDYDIEPVRLLSAPKVPGLADLVEVDWLDFIGYVRLREVPPLESLPLVDPSPLPVKAALNSPASPEKRWAAASALELELDPIPLPLQREQVRWIFDEPVSEAPLLTPWLAEKATSEEDNMQDLLPRFAKSCDFYREIPPLSPLAPSRQQRSVPTRPERPVFGPIGLSWETMDCQLNLLVPRELSGDMTRIELKDDFTASGDDTAAAAVDAVKRIFNRELSSVRRGGWEQTILWDKSWSGTALGLPQPPEFPPVDWLVPKDTSTPHDLPVLAEREVDSPCDAAQAELLWRWARDHPDAGRARLNLCIRSWELLTTSAVGVAPLFDEQQVTELTPTQEQDESHFEEGGGALERCSSSESPSTPPPPLMSCKSDHPSVPVTIDVERQSDCVCVRKSASIGRTAKVIRATGEPSAVTTLRAFHNKHWDRLRRFCGMHGLGVPTAQASLYEAEEIWRHSLSRKPRRSAQQLGSLALRCIVLSTLLEAFASYGSVGLLMAARAVPNEYRNNTDTLGRTLVELLSRLESSKSVLTQCPILRSLRSLLTGARQVRTLVVVVSSSALADNYERVSRKLLGMLGEDISVVDASQAGTDCGGGGGRRTLCFIPEWGILPDAVISEDASDCYARDPTLCSLLSRSGVTVVAFEALLGLEYSNPVAFDLIKFHIRHGKEGATSLEELSVRLKAAASKELGEALMAARIACKPALAGAVSLPGISAVVELRHQTSVAVLDPHSSKQRASTLEAIRRMARSLKRLYVVVPLVASRSKVSSTGDASLAMSMCLEELGCGPGHGSRLAVEGWTETTLKLGMMDKVVPLAVPVRGSVIDSVVNIIKQLAATQAVSAAAFVFP
ncbi:hypothetical protein FOZ62_017571, partial [Perkinsus olseni]